MAYRRFPRGMRDERNFVGTSLQTSAEAKLVEAQKRRKFRQRLMERAAHQRVAASRPPFANMSRSLAIPQLVVEIFADAFRRDFSGSRRVGRAFGGKSSSLLAKLTASSRQVPSRERFLTLSVT